MNSADLRGVAERALAHAAGSEAQVTASWERGLIATGGGTRADDVVTVEVTAVAGGGLGHSSTTNTDDESLERVVHSAQRAAESSRNLNARLPEPAAGRGHEAFDPAVLAADPAAIDLPEHMIWEAGAARVLVRSTRGVDAFEQRTFVRGTYDWREQGRGVRLTAAATHLHGVDLHALSREGRALGGDAPAGSAAPGDVPVVLGHQAVAEVLEWLRWTFSPHGEALARRGQRIASACVSLNESPRYPGTLARSFDVEGVPREPVPLVQDGVAHRVVWDTVSAALADGDVASTGHAGQAGRPLPFPHHLVLVGGGAADAAELARPLDSGLFIAAIPSVESSEEGVVSGEAGGVFAIRGGEIAEPLADPRVEVRPLELLAAVQALTSAQRIVPTYGGARHVGASVVPALRAGAGIRVI